MGNCLPYLWHLLSNSRSADGVQLPRKVSITCACFHSKVVDDGESVGSDDRITKQYLDKFYRRRKSLSMPELHKISCEHSSSYQSINNSND